MWTVYDDKDILFVNRVVMSRLVEKGIASTQTEAWDLMRKALKSCFQESTVKQEKTVRQQSLKEFERLDRNEA